MPLGMNSLPCPFFFWCGVNFVYLTKDKRKDKGHAKRLVNGLNKKNNLSPFCDKAVVANLCYCYFAVQITKLSASSSYAACDGGCEAQ